jgi:tRNA-dihydrouridine synthase A
MIVDSTIAHSDKLDDILEFVGDANSAATTTTPTTACTSLNNSTTTNKKTTNRVICQIGGNSPQLCGEATQVVANHGYDEINLNIDCPSDRVCGKCEFGAILMKQIDTAYAVVEAMFQNSRTVPQELKDDGTLRTRSIPVSIKCRVGVDDFDNLDYLVAFIERLQPVCRRFILHARKCVLDGIMNARQNRSVPPLNYPRVYELCNLFPNCDFWINGGIRTLKQARAICITGGRYEDDGCDQGESLVAEDDIVVPTEEDNENDEYRVNNPLMNEQRTSWKHAVPCSLCNTSYGSCIAPPLVVPPNLRGCMLGRAAMDNPCVFWDVDRYFYGLGSNPCHTRRQVLEQYCQYLEGLYPRRCCDTDERITFKIPVPLIEKSCQTGDDYCAICRAMYQGNNREPYRSLMSSNHQNRKGDLGPTKMSSRLVGRSLKPVRGMFFGQRKAKTFIRSCDQLAQDLAVRNCGPGFILRVAMLAVGDDILDQEFVKSEDVD